jgi:hypothetical protein
MAVFENKFFSAAGQKERISNVGATLKAAVTGKGVQSNTGIKAVDSVLSAAASRPFTTAAIGAAGFSAATIGGKATIAAVTTKPVIGTMIAAPVIGSVVGQVGVKKSAQAVGNVQSNLSNFAGNIAGFVKDPSWDDFKNIGKENPWLAGLSAAAVAGLAGKVVAPMLLTDAVRDNTKAIKEQDGQIIISNDGLSQLQPVTPQTQVLGRAAGTTQKRISKSKKKLAASQPNINIRINNQTRSQKHNFIKQLTYNRRGA